MTEKKTEFTKQYRIPFYECDYTKRMKISAILKYAAEIAGLDYTLKGFGHEELWEKQMVFLLSRISMKINRYPTQQEIVNVTTWECGKKGALFNRGVDFTTPDGEKLVSYISGWVLANPITRKIYRPSHFDFNMPQNMEKPIEALPISKIAPKNIELIGKKVIMRSDLDCNGHVYNANYADMVGDLISKENYERDVENYRINYINEAKLGETIEFYKENKSNNILAIIGKIQEKVCFEVEYIFK